MHRTARFIALNEINVTFSGNPSSTACANVQVPVKSMLKNATFPIRPIRHCLHEWVSSNSKYTRNKCILELRANGERALSDGIEMQNASPHIVRLSVIKKADSRWHTDRLVTAEIRSQLVVCIFAQLLSRYALFQVVGCEFFHAKSPVVLETISQCFCYLCCRRCSSPTNYKVIDHRVPDCFSATVCVCVCVFCEWICDWRIVNRTDFMQNRWPGVPSVDRALVDISWPHRAERLSENFTSVRTLKNRKRRERLVFT